MSDSMRQCKDCGFLCARRDNGLIGAGIGHRESGRAWEFVCLWRNPELDEKLCVREPAGSTTPHDWNATINLKHGCKDWIRWIEMYDPKEHAEMSFLEEQRKWQEKMEARNRVTNLFCAVIGIVATMAGVGMGYWLSTMNAAK